MRFSLAIVAVAAMAVSSTAVSAAELIVNGGFEQTTGLGQPDYNTTVTGWSSHDGNGGAYYSFVMDGATADTAGASGQYGTLTLWGPGNGEANGLGPSPDGGNFIAADGAFITGPLSQTLTGLTAGADYNVKFYWAGAQQQGYTGEQTEQWEVSFGGAPSQFTSVYQNSSHGFSGWISETFTFTATGTSQVLSFLAHGTPNGVPPFSLLDGVSVTAAVPEPATWALMLVGFGAVGFAARRKTAVVAA